MADYKIAPDSTGIISLGAMRKSLVAEADYAASSKHTTASTSVNTLVGTPSTYQTNCDSFTWSATSPKGFQEMYGETWSDGSGGGGGATTYTFTLSANNNNNCDRSTVTVKVNGTTVATMTSPSGQAPQWNVSSFQATTAQSVVITATSQGGGGVGCNTFDTTVIVSKQGTPVISTSVTGGGATTHTFTPSANQAISVTSTATV